jgi:dephospho-CoA kinase
MTIIGLCGGSGAGKGIVAEKFALYGIPSIDADAVYRDISGAGSPLLSELKLAFGEGIISSDGELDRRALASLVFSEKGRTELLPILNKITHKAVICETERRIAELSESGIPAVIFDAPQLFESGFNTKCDKIVSVIADREIRIARIMNRDSISRERATARIESQLSDEFFSKNSDFIIVNNGSEERLERAVAEIAEKILNK